MCVSNACTLVSSFFGMNIWCLKKDFKINRKFLNLIKKVDLNGKAYDADSSFMLQD